MIKKAGAEVMGENILMLMLEAMIAVFVVIGLVGIRKQKEKRK